jgi:hypothetical protein
VKNDGIELINYLRLFWKRKYILIVGTVIGLVVGLQMVKREPKLYRVELLLNMGKEVDVLPSGSFNLRPFGDIKTIANIIKAKYSLSKERSSEFDLTYALVAGTHMCRIATLGHVKGETVERLKKIINGFCEEYSLRTEKSLHPVYEAIKRLKISEAEMVVEVARTSQIVKELTSSFTANGTNNASYLLNAESALWEKKSSLLNVRSKLMFYETFIKDVDQYKTRVVGEVEGTIIDTRKTNSVIKTTGLGLVICLLLALIIEYIEKVRRFKGM